MMHVPWRDRDISDSRRCGKQENAVYNALRSPYQKKKKKRISNSNDAYRRMSIGPGRTNLGKKYNAKAARQKSAVV